MPFFIILWNKISNKFKIYFLLISVLILTFIYYNWRVNSLEVKLKITEGNIAAFTDSIRIVKTKNGELETVKLALLADKNSLKQLSDSLDVELKKEKGKVKYIVSSTVNLKHDTIVVASHVVDSNIQWAYDNEDAGGSQHLAGVSNKVITKITRNELSLNLVTGLKERGDKKMEIFIRSKYPGVTFSNVEGAIIDPLTPIVKPPSKPFSVGPCISAIVTPTGAFQYGVGISVQWGILRF